MRECNVDHLDFCNRDWDRLYVRVFWSECYVDRLDVCTLNREYLDVIFFSWIIRRPFGWLYSYNWDYLYVIFLSTSTVWIFVNHTTAIISILRSYQYQVPGFRNTTVLVAGLHKYFVSRYKRRPSHITVAVSSFWLQCNVGRLFGCLHSKLLAWMKRRPFGFLHSKLRYFGCQVF